MTDMSANKLELRYVADKILSLRNSRNLLQEAYAARIGVSVRTLARYEKAETVPDILVAARIAREAGISIDELIGRPPQVVPTTEVAIVAPEEVERLIREKEQLASYIPVPLVGDQAAARDPLEIRDTDIEGYAVIYAAWLKPAGRYSCVRIRGRSMLPILADGDIVAVNHARTDIEELNKRIAAVSLDDGVTIKYIQLEPDRRHVVVYAENRAEWEPVYIEADQLRVVGAVEWAWRRFE